MKLVGSLVGNNWSSLQLKAAPLAVSVTMATTIKRFFILNIKM